MPTKYLAITIAGAVSLGAYEAGAMYEILEAIRQHNEDAATKVNGDFICIDVVTGASAGAMTAAIMAQKLLYQSDTFGGPYDNPLYNVWVKGISLALLLKSTDGPIEKGGDPAALSLLSSQLINRIASDTLGKDDGHGRVPIMGGAHNAIHQKRGLRLGMALTNLNGMNYGYKMFDGTDFLYTQFSDQMLRQFFPDNTELAPWKAIENGAVASGAFPFAFRTKDVNRSRSEYPKDSTLQAWPGGDEQQFTYTDGGVLQNQPLGMAKNLVDLNDDHRDNENRFYLFVSPSAMTGEQNMGIEERSTTMLGVGKRLIGLYMAQAGFRDWIEAENINDQIELLDTRARELTACLKGGSVAASVLIAASNPLLDLLYATDGGPAAKSRDIDRLQDQYRLEIAELGAGTPESEALVLGVLTLEKSAELGERDRMRIYGVVTDKKVLAGGKLADFLAFFDQAYRDHDYDWGRTVAQTLLTQNVKFNAAGELGPIRYKPSTIRDIDRTLDAVKLKDVSRADVTVLRTGVKKRVHDFIADKVSNPFWRVLTQTAASVVLGLVIDWEFSKDI